jgi:hypothetical protein
VRTLLMRSMAKLMEKVDPYIGTGASQDLPMTNLTGHPAVVMPDGFSDRDGRQEPGSITLTGRLYDETTLLALAHAYQRAVGSHLKRPPLDRYLVEEKEREEKAKQEKAKGETEKGREVAKP